MPRLRYHVIAAGLCAAVMLAGCLPTAIPTLRPYLLVRQEGADLVVVESEAAIYDRFDRDVFSAPALQCLLSLFDHTRLSYTATGTIAPHPQSARDRLVIVLDSESTDVLRNLTVWDGTRYVSIDRAAGVGPAGGADADQVREALVQVLPWLLLELVGYAPLPTGEDAPWPHQAAAPEQAVAQGFALAVGTLCAEGGTRGALAPELTNRVWSEDYVEPLDALIRDNQFRYRFRAGAPAFELRPREELLRTPGVAATLFYRLLQQMDAGYPQRFMLWFVNYDGHEIPYAKLSLAISRMGRGPDGIEAFVDSYAETFPAERRLITSLAEEVFGSGR